MASIFRIAILLVSVATAINAAFKFDYNSENIKAAEESYRKCRREGGNHLDFNLVNTGYSTVFNRNFQREYGIEFIATETVIPVTTGRDSSSTSTSRTPIAHTGRPGIMANLKNNAKSSKGLVSCFKQKTDQLFHISNIQLLLKENDDSKEYLDLRVEFSDSTGKNFIQVKIPLFGDAIHTRRRPVGSFEDPVLTITTPIIRKLPASTAQSSSQSGTEQFVTEISWMENVLSRAVYQMTENYNKECTDIYITDPVVMVRKEINKLLEMDLYMKQYICQ